MNERSRVINNSGKGISTRFLLQGICGNIVEFESVGYLFATATPTKEGDFREQAEEVIHGLKDLAREAPSPFNVVRLTVFLKESANRVLCHEIVEEVFDEITPATVCITQPPCEGKELIVEAWGVEIKNSKVEIEQPRLNLVNVRHGDTKWIHCGEISSNGREGAVYEDAIKAFRKMKRALESADYRFDQVIRTWLYLGDIVAIDNGSLRYDELNRARSDVYAEIEFGNNLRSPTSFGQIYPSSTGVGTSERNLVISCIALQADREDVLVVPLENPMQTPAFRYDDRFRQGTPKFCRAVAIVTPNDVMTMVSGTASIVNSKTVHVGDVLAQTEQTIDNIEHLISSENFDRCGIPKVSMSLSDLSVARVYVKRPAEYDRIRDICESRFGDVPTIYAIADICRPELLVEIEGVAFSKRG